MAKVTYPVCTKNPVPVGPHCWHTVWRASTYQAGQHDSEGKRCCWCGADAPLTITYALPIPHGPHAPASPQFTSMARLHHHDHQAGREDVEPGMGVAVRPTSADRSSRPDHGIGEPTRTNRGTTAQAGGSATNSDVPPKGNG
jgi:hypothetical protein